MKIAIARHLLKFFLAAVLLNGFVWAQRTTPTAPNLTQTGAWVQLPLPECMGRAREALTAGGMALHTPTSTAYGGNTADLFAIVTCMMFGNQIWVNVAVAGAPDRGNPYGMAMFLRDYMQTGQRPGGAGPPACGDLSGSWRHETANVGQSVWHLTRTGQDRYSAQESGLGAARGTAVVTGAKIRLDWASSGHAGYYEWTFSGSCQSATGVLVFTAGAVGSQSSTLTRGGPATPQPQTRPPSPPPARPATPPPAPAGFGGSWSCTIAGAKGSLPMSLTQNGNSAGGSYGNGGRVNGTLNGNVLSGRWSDQFNGGDFRFTLAADGRRIEGSYSMPGGGGPWNCVKQ